MRSIGSLVSANVQLPVSFFHPNQIIESPKPQTATARPNRNLFSFQQASLKAEPEKAWSCHCGTPKALLEAGMIWSAIDVSNCLGQRPAETIAL
jgi:hypothetical protein